MSNDIISYKNFIDDSGKKEYIDPYNISNVHRPNEKNRIIRGIGLCKLPDVAKRRWGIKS